jgi:hypothetical protein
MQIAPRNDRYTVTLNINLIEHALKAYVPEWRIRQYARAIIKAFAAHGVPVRDHSALLMIVRPQAGRWLDVLQFAVKPAYGSAAYNVSASVRELVKELAGELVISYEARDPATGETVVTYMQEGGLIDYEAGDDHTAILFKDAAHTPHMSGATL